VREQRLGVADRHNLVPAHRQQRRHAGAQDGGVLSQDDSHVDA
jgi:hypothetical protein